jgi:hypothetical protein
MPTGGWTTRPEQDVERTHPCRYSFLNSLGGRAFDLALIAVHASDIVTDRLSRRLELGRGMTGKVI